MQISAPMNLAQKSKGADLALEMKNSSSYNKTMSKFNGMKSALDALKHLPETQQKKILEQIAKADPLVAKKLSKGIFEFSDLHQLQKKEFLILWWEVPREQWHLALRQIEPKMMEMIHKSLSARAHEELIADLKAKGPQSLKKVLAAQAEILALAQDLATKGRIQLPKK